MRVQLVTLLVVIAAIEYAAEAMRPTPVAASPIDFSDESNSTVNEGDGDRMISFDSLLQKAKGFFVSSPSKGLNKVDERPALVGDQLEIADEQLIHINDQLEKAYERLQLEGSDDKLFKKLNFLLWLEVANELAVKYRQSNSALVIDSLTKRLNDRRVADLIQIAKKDSKTNAIAVELEKAQMKYWLEGETSAAMLLGLLRMEYGRYGPLTHPLFNYWRTYAKKFNVVHSGQKPSLLQSLTDYYDDKEVAAMLQLALQDTSSAELAKNLQKQQIMAWVKHDRSLDEVFGLLGLDRAGYKLLEDPLLNVFTKFTEVLNNTPRKFWLRDKQTEKGTFEAAMYAPSTSFTITASDKALFQMWFVKKKDPATVFKQFLTKAGDNLLTSPLFTTFLKYADTYRLTNRKDVRVQKIIYDYYKDEGPALVTKMLALKKAPDASARYVALRVEADMFRHYMDPKEPISPDDFFEFLKLNDVEEPAELFQNHLFEYWIDDFLDVFIKLPNAKHVLRSCLATAYNGDAILLAIAEAKRNDKTKKLATKVEAELFKQYAFAKIDPPTSSS
ncbi:unnamed protein product [Peronospora destructor]|uniref:RxLR effector protein n=1 Tax=Peronospora destructor TaxID=86335 RepID=A0AAV0VGV5_9STRA|nr:unnamed protein product [Peronospora destructor]